MFTCITAVAVADDASVAAVASAAIAVAVSNWGSGGDGGDAGVSVDVSHYARLFGFFPFAAVVHAAAMFHCPPDTDRNVHLVQIHWLVQANF